MKRDKILTLYFSKVFLGKNKGFMYEVRMGDRVESRNLSNIENTSRTIALIVEQVLPSVDAIIPLPCEHDLHIKFNQEFKGKGRIFYNLSTQKGEISNLLITVPFSEEEIMVIHEALTSSKFDFFSFSK